MCYVHRYFCYYLPRFKINRLRTTDLFTTILISQYHIYIFNTSQTINKSLSRSVARIEACVVTHARCAAISRIPWSILYGPSSLPRSRVISIYRFRATAVVPTVIKLYFIVTGEIAGIIFLLTLVLIIITVALK